MLLGFANTLWRSLPQTSGFNGTPMAAFSSSARTTQSQRLERGTRHADEHFLSHLWGWKQDGEESVEGRSYVLGLWRAAASRLVAAPPQRVLGAQHRGVSTQLRGAKRRLLRRATSEQRALAAVPGFQGFLRIRGHRNHGARLGP